MDEFLGESGKATIVLLKLAAGEKPPSIRELKRDLEVDSIKYYKSDGACTNESASVRVWNWGENPKQMTMFFCR